MLTVNLGGVSCRMGVGGRRHRKRRRAEERMHSRHAMPRWMRMRLPW